jgi:GNAT superfamily N-acetyltransferase
VIRCSARFARLHPSMLSIRRAEARDVPEILSLIRELAAYERAPGEVTATEADLLRDGFSGAPCFFVELAEWEGAVAGFAFWFFNYSTWQGRSGLYLEDLFVRPAFRGRGIGRSLLAHLARIAVAQGCGRFQWQVLDWNTPALAFYEALGAKPLAEWVAMRMAGEALERLAASSRA